MALDQLTPYLPILAIAAGVVLILWTQRAQVKALLGRRPAAGRADAALSPAERFTTFYALRTWCEQAGHSEAVEALDSRVLPAIVRPGTDAGGGAAP